jgi:hypothetical protein
MSNQIVQPIVAEIEAKVVKQKKAKKAKVVAEVPVLVEEPVIVASESVDALIEEDDEEAILLKRLEEIKNKKARTKNAENVEKFREARITAIEAQMEDITEKMEALEQKLEELDQEKEDIAEGKRDEELLEKENAKIGVKSDRTVTGKVKVPVKDGQAPRRLAVPGKGDMRSALLKSLLNSVEKEGLSVKLTPSGNDGYQYGFYKKEICDFKDGVWTMPVWNVLRKRLPKGMMVGIFKDEIKRNIVE